MKIRPLLLTALALASAGLTRAQVPALLNHQGRIIVNNINFNGTGRFKFAIVRAGGGPSLWSNDGTSVAGSEPAAFVALPVLNGLYGLALGDTTLPNMQAVPPSLFRGQRQRRPADLVQ